jgi:NadR type nicotinamide-nucleotide adenylyltransferase
MEETHRKRIKVAIVGPESSGKTTLCKDLSEALNARWVPEFAREQLTINPEYSQEDLDSMLCQQLLNEQKLKTHLLFCDGDPVSFKIWSSYKYGSVSPYIEEMVTKSKYNYYLLLRPDLPYQEDPLRENSSEINRKELFHLFESELIRNKFNYSIVNGKNSARINVALKALRKQNLV